MKPKDSDAKQFLASRIKHLRNGRGMTQAKLAEATGLTDGAIKMLETGRRWPRPETLDLLAKALLVPRSQLTGDGLADPPEELSANRIFEYVLTLEKENARLYEFWEQHKQKAENDEYYAAKFATISDIVEPLAKASEKIQNAVRVAIGIPEIRSSRSKKQTS